MAGLSQRLFALGRPNLERQLAHPTVRGIANGDLDQPRFRSWLVQDYLFLLDYVRLFALAHATFHQELSLHRAYAAEFGLAQADLDRAEKSPQCAAYTDFLLRTAATAEFAEVLAALLACMWGYSELGRALAATGLPTESRYRRWIETYADPGFAALAAWCAALLDRAADGLPAARLAACERAFLTSLRHEHAFWDAE
jgi:thiaminase/transcriptional activator TenA